jgi:hypothetical protein
VTLVVGVPLVRAGKEVWGELERERDEVEEGVEDFVVQVLTSAR